ncbi:MAG: ATP-binding cassette domain-containing protein [Actinomycetota bacterium]
MRGVTFTSKGNTVGLLGPNGAGKTTLLRIIGTVLAPDGGSVRALGRDPANADDRLELRRRLGYLPQEPGFQRGFSAFEFVDYVAILKEWTQRRARHDEVRRVLALVDLSAESGRKIRRLSGGMRRRVALAAVLLGDRALLVLDEPTVGLDPEQRLRFRDILSRVGGDRTVLLSTHQTEDVAAMCDEVVVLHEGAVRFQGPPASLAALAEGRVWFADERDPAAQLSWRAGDGRHRHVGDPPAGATTEAPTLEDGYLLLLGAPAQAVPA